MVWRELAKQDVGKPFFFLVFSLLVCVCVCVHLSMCDSMSACEFPYMCVCVLSLGEENVSNGIYRRLRLSISDGWGQLKKGEE